MMMSESKILLILLFFTDENSFLLKQKPAPNQPATKNFISFRMQDDVIFDVRLHCLFSIFFQKLRTKETRFPAFSERYQQDLFGKRNSTTLQQFKQN